MATATRTDPQIWRALGLSDAEYDRICDLLGREPRATELAMFSVEWSEHCGYPRSRAHLARLPKAGKWPVITGQDAGGIEVAPGLAVVFKMESHNHPSQVEPKQGAATGVGGILRDIFCSGARPVALADSLRFGDIERDPRARYLFAGVVDGIQSYGNCVGVPTVAGEVRFHPRYAGNCLVNVMCVGVAPTAQLATAAAAGPGNAVVYVGARTGRDGIGGASVLASQELRADDEKRPSVQIGDPLAEKCLIEATLEALATGALVAVKDMGAAGLTCTTAEMSAAGGVGMTVDLDRVPRREEGMKPWEVMLSESQERMLAVVAEGREDEALAVFRKWDLHAEVIGRVTEEPVVRIYDGGELVAEVRAGDLAEAPLYDLPAQPPKPFPTLDMRMLAEPRDYNAALLDLLRMPDIASKRWAYRQYDQTVQANTVVAAGGDAAVLRLKERPPLGIALTTEGNGRWCALDPRRGVQLAVLEAACNLVCAGAEPAAVTNCLNFGNPDKPDRFWYFKEAVEGLAEACRALEVPVVSGNVSFYNESEQGPVLPTPVVGLVGVVEDVRRVFRPAFARDGDQVFLLGAAGDTLGGSAYLWRQHGLEAGPLPEADFAAARRLHACCRTAQRNLPVGACHDCSDGGLAVALAEMAVAGGRGARMRLPEQKLGGAAVPAVGARADVVLFNEAPSRILVTVPANAADALVALATQHLVPCAMLGTVGGSDLRIESPEGNALVSVDVEQMREAYEGALPALMA